MKGKVSPKIAALALLILTFLVTGSLAVKTAIAPPQGFEPGDGDPGN